MKEAAVRRCLFGIELSADRRGQKTRRARDQALPWGQAAARNILGRSERFDTVPFFWTSQYDFMLNYVGHAEKWDKLDLDGSLEEHNRRLLFRRGGKTLAFRGRYRESLEHELAMERSVQVGLATN
jgi:hypothetical protein